MGHHCCVPRCNSNSRYSGVLGLTFHAFPIDPKERKLWILSVRRADYNKLTVSKHTKVCSKHFRNEDFIQGQNSKRRMLKKGVVPSVFAWSDDEETSQSDKKSEPPAKPVREKLKVKIQAKIRPSGESNTNSSRKETNSTKDINKESSVKEKNELSETATTVPTLEKKTESKISVSNVEKKAESKMSVSNAEKKIEPKSSANVSERKIKTKNVKKESNGVSVAPPPDMPTPDLSCSSPTKSDDSEQGSDVTPNGSSTSDCTPSKRSSAVNFQIGTRLEAKDLGNEMWYPVKVVEVDWDDEEVLIHFEKWSQRYDEWVPMDSSRLRQTQKSSPQSDGKNVSKVFSIGDRVMAKWSDCRRYPAKVKTVLGNDRYEVLFFDGFTKSIKGIRMTKLESEDFDSKIGPGASEKLVPPVIPKPVIKNEVISEPIGTKEERRERKRKINVVELFHPKKRVKLDAELCPKPATDGEKGKKAEKGKRRKENHSDVNEGVNEGQTEISETPRGRKKEYPDDTSKPASRTGQKEIERDDIKRECDEQDDYIVESGDGPRKATIILDKKLPPGWSKHTVQRKHGNSAGKWDVFLVNSQGRRFQSRNEIRRFCEENGEPFKAELFDFCVSRRKRRAQTSDGSIPVPKRKRGSGGKAKPVVGPGGDGLEEPSLPLQQPTSVPQIQRRVKTLLPKIRPPVAQSEEDGADKVSEPRSPPPPYTTTVASIPAIKIQPEPPVEGEVLVGGLKIQMENNTYKCPKESCGKNFRKENLLQMHIKHYHPEYNKFMGSTPNVADLAYARTIGESIDDLMPKSRYSGVGTIGLSGTPYVEKFNRPEATRKTKTAVSMGAGGSKTAGVVGSGGAGDCSPAPDKKKVTSKEKQQSVPSTKKPGKGMAGDGEGRTPADESSGESKEPKEEKPTVVDTRENTSTPVSDTAMAVTHREEKKEPQTTIKTLMPVIRSPSHAQEPSTTERMKNKFPAVEEGEEYIEVIDVGPRQTPPSRPPVLQPEVPVPVTSSQGTTSLTKSLRTVRRRRLSDFHFEPLHRRRKIASTSKLELSEEVDVVDDRSSVDVTSPVTTTTAGTAVSSAKSNPTTYRYSRKKTPIVHLEKLNVVTDSNAEQPVVEQLRKEELINCTCGFMEEDGLMIQCDLCLCWQHGLCNNIEKETEVPEKYVCPICLNPYRQRKSKKYLHDQDWLKEGKVPSLSFRSKNDGAILERETILKRSHDLTGSLLQIQQVLHSLRVKVNIAGKPDHPKLYLWAKSWEKDGESSTTHNQSSAPHTQMSSENEFKPQDENTPACLHAEVKPEQDTNVIDSSVTVEKDVSLIDVKVEEEETPTGTDKSESKVEEGKAMVIDQEVQEETVIVETETTEVVSSIERDTDEINIDSKPPEESVETVISESVVKSDVLCSSDVDSLVRNEEVISSDNQDKSGTAAITQDENTETTTEVVEMEVDTTPDNLDTDSLVKTADEANQEIKPAKQEVAKEEDCSSKSTEDCSNKSTEDCSSKSIEDCIIKLTEDSSSKPTEDCGSKSTEHSSSKPTEECDSKSTEDCSNKLTEDYSSKPTEVRSNKPTEDSIKLTEDSAQKLEEKAMPSGDPTELKQDAAGVNSSQEDAIKQDGTSTEDPMKPSAEAKPVTAEPSAPSNSEETADVNMEETHHGLLHQALTNGSHGANSLGNGGIGSQLDTTGHPMLQLPICQNELMRFASSIADNLSVSESTRPAVPAAPVPEPPRAPQPEAPIDPVECRLCLLDHIDNFQTQIDTRLTMLEEQVAALESQDPDAAKDEAADFYPQTKQTIQMLLRDLLTLRKISALN